MRLVLDKNGYVKQRILTGVFSWKNTDKPAC
jgi:hypothetical protein